MHTGDYIRRSCPLYDGWALGDIMDQPARVEGMYMYYISYDFHFASVTLGRYSS